MQIINQIYILNCLRLRLPAAATSTVNQPGTSVNCATVGQRREREGEVRRCGSVEVRLRGGFKLFYHGVDVR